MVTAAVTLDCDVPDADPDLPSVPDPVGESDDCGRPDSRLRRASRIVVPLLIGVGAISAVVSMSGDSREMGAALARVQPSLVAAALVCEIVSFACLGVHLALLGGPEANVRRLAPFRLAWVLFGLGSILPAAPAEGLVMAGLGAQNSSILRAIRGAGSGVRAKSALVAFWPAGSCRRRLGLGDQCGSWWRRSARRRWVVESRTSRTSISGRTFLKEVRVTRGWSSTTPSRALNAVGQIGLRSERG